ncbi:hypothetical protein CsatB_004488 [Cannabis sativa]
MRENSSGFNEETVSIASHHSQTILMSTIKQSRIHINLDTVTIWRCPMLITITDRGEYWESTGVACNDGRLYWRIKRHDECVGILALDLFAPKKEEEKVYECVFIAMPKEFEYLSRPKIVEERTTTTRRRISIHMLRNPRTLFPFSSVIGVVRGRLRLCQSYWIDNEISKIHLKSWELKWDDDDWVLVHDGIVNIKEETTTTTNEELLKLNVIGMHRDPDDHHDVFFFYGQIGCSKFSLYQIGGIGGDEIILRKVSKTKKDMSHLPYIKQFTLVHPWLPTTIPPLPTHPTIDNSIY